MERRTSTGRLRALAAAAALALLAAPLAACAPEEPEPEKLSASRAGGVYLDAVCPVNAAWDVVDVELDRLRLAIERGDADTDAVAEALTEVGEASADAAGELDADTHEWPAGAAAPVAEVRRTLLADRKQAAKLAEQSAAEIAAYQWDGGDAAGAAAAEARAALGLPEDPAFACAEWEAQQRTADETPAPAETPNPTSREDGSDD